MRIMVSSNCNHNTGDAWNSRCTSHKTVHLKPVPLVLVPCARLYDQHVRCKTRISTKPYNYYTHQRVLQRHVKPHKMPRIGRLLSFWPVDSVFRQSLRCRKNKQPTCTYVSIILIGTTVKNFLVVFVSSDRTLPGQSRFYGRYEAPSRCPAKFGSGWQMSRIFPSHTITTFLDICAYVMNSQTGGSGGDSSRTSTNRPVTGRNERGRGICVDR
jgi:hypothetical protein